MAWWDLMLRAEVTVMFASLTPNPFDPARFTIDHERLEANREWRRDRWNARHASKRHCERVRERRQDPEEHAALLIKQREAVHRWNESLKANPEKMARELERRRLYNEKRRKGSR